MVTNDQPDQKTVREVLDELVFILRDVQNYADSLKGNGDDYNLNIISSQSDRAVEIVSSIEALSEEEIRRKLHDLNNALTSVIGRTDLLIQTKDKDKKYGSILSAMSSKCTRAMEISSNIGRSYIEKGEVQPQNASKYEGLEETVYHIIHVDDNPEIRTAVFKALTESSNLNPKHPGTFGHDGNKKVRYTVEPYENVHKTLERLSASKENVDLLITDMEMPDGRGTYILENLNQQFHTRERKPPYKHAKNIAVLTGGISKEEATRIEETYGVKVLTKPFSPLVLEQKIYNIINQKATQS